MLFPLLCLLQISLVPDSVKDLTQREYSWENKGLFNTVVNKLMSKQSAKINFFWLKKNIFLIGHCVTPTVRDSIKFSQSRKGPQCQKFCFNKKILILKNCQVAMVTIYLQSQGWWYSVIFLSRKSKLDVAKEFNKSIFWTRSQHTAVFRQYDRI